MKGVSKKQLLEENRALKAALEKERTENLLLRQKVDLLIRKVFGASSEKLDPSQLDLFLLQAETTPGNRPPPPPRRRLNLNPHAAEAHHVRTAGRKTCPSSKR